VYKTLDRSEHTADNQQSPGNLSPYPDKLPDHVNAVRRTILALNGVVHPAWKKDFAPEGALTPPKRAWLDKTGIKAISPSQKRDEAEARRATRSSIVASPQFKELANHDEDSWILELLKKVFKPYRDTEMTEEYESFSHPIFASTGNSLITSAS
jgi:hypothetical protein